MSKKVISGAIAILGLAGFSHAETPILQTAAPVIHLADNLDEEDALGWCIDTQGRGFGELLHAHSCKPRGGDVQFRFEEGTGLIRSFAFAEYCMARAPNERTTFALKACDEEDDAQDFKYAPETGRIMLSADATQCLAVGAESRSAGPFMSRDLILSPCADTPEKFITWVVLQ